MAIFSHIILNNIIPIFMIMGLGIILSRKFELNLNTLSKFIFYLFVPCFIFYNLYTATLSFDMLKILFLAITYLLASDLIGRIISKIRKYDVGMTNAFKNSIIFSNSGNIGISLVTLVFGSFPFVIDGKTPYLNQALTAQVIILVFTNITLNTVGFLQRWKSEYEFQRINS